MGDFSPFPELSIEDLETLRSLDPELEITSGFEGELESYPFGFSPMIDFQSGDLALTSGARIPYTKDQNNLAQWVMQTCLTERWESPLVSGAIGLEISNLVGQVITQSTLIRIGAQIPAAIKAHDRIRRCFVQRVFSLGSDVYVQARYETDEDEDQSVLVRIEG